MGKSPWEAAVDASSSRFRPIMLTAVSTVLGMIPIAPTVFWGPMAFAIMGSLLVATVLTLVFLPTLYVAWFGASERTDNRANRRKHEHQTNWGNPHLRLGSQPDVLRNEMSASTMLETGG